MLTEKWQQLLLIPYMTLYKKIQYEWESEYPVQ